jgi:hypothetical protein
MSGNRMLDVMKLDGDVENGYTVRRENCHGEGVYGAAVAFCLSVLEIFGVLLAKRTTRICIAAWHYPLSLLKETGKKQMTFPLSPALAEKYDMACPDRQFLLPQNKVSNVLQRHKVHFEHQLAAEFLHYVRAPSFRSDEIVREICTWETLLPKDSESKNILNQRPKKYLPSLDSVGFAWNDTGISERVEGNENTNAVSTNGWDLFAV